MNETMSQTMKPRARKTMETLCRRCQFHPASSRIAGYCSWDCYDADDEGDEGDDAEGDGEGEKAA